MTYHLSLKLVGVVLALAILASHVFALRRPDDVRAWLVRFPRSRRIGEILLGVNVLWAFVIAWTMDWGEFYYLQTYILFLLPVFAFLTWQFVDEFLAVRMAGILLLLAAAPVLDAAFLQPIISRLLVVVLAYAWVVMGMLWVSQPHLLRDQISWANRQTARYNLLAGAGVVYGTVLLLCALAFY